jgi:hypothetical protein
MPRHIGRIAVAWTLITAVASGSYAQSPGPDAAAAEALAELNHWLDSAPNGVGWRKYLRLDDLGTQIAAGSKADPTQVVAVLRRLESDAPGLDRPPFVRLRQAVAGWHRELSAPTLEQLPSVVQQAKSQFQAVDQAQLEAGRAKVASANASLRQFLGRGATAKGWQSYLALDKLDAELRKSTGQSPEPLAEVLARLRTDQDGLELPQFTNLAAALADYVAAIRQSRNPNARAEFDTTIDRLGQELEAQLKQPAADTLKQIGRDLHWLARRRQALSAVDSVTYRLSQPNLFITVSGDFVAAGLNRSVDETGPLRDVILGTNIVGTGRTRGDVTFRLIPDADVARLEATLEGVNRSRNTGYNGPAIVHSIGTTRLLATKYVTIDGDGVHGQKANVGADTSTEITGIGSSKRGMMGRFVERVASKRVSQQKATAERIASEHAEQRLGRRFEDQVGQELARANERFQERFRNPLVRRGHFPHMRLSSTSDHLYATALQAVGPQLGAQSAPPAVPGKPQISLRLHDSLVNNFTAGTLAGETIGQPELEKFAMDIMGEVPERLKQDPGKEPWTITFTDEEPVSFSLADGGFVLTGRGRKYTSGDRSFPAMNFTVKYHIEKVGQGVKGTRIGDVEIFPPGFVQGGGRPLSLRQTALRNLMIKRLEKIFEPEIVKDQPMELKEEWKAAGPLEVTHIAAENGWLNAGWRQVQATNVALTHRGDKPSSIDLRTERRAR